MGRKRVAQWWGRWALLACLGAAGGCGRSIQTLETAQQRERLLRRAEAKEREGDREGALVLWNEALERNPRLTSAHLKAALLYDDYKKDYVRCVYHYQRYLELLPETEKRAMIEESIRRARLLLAASYAGQPAGADDRLDALQAENERLKRAVRQLRAQAAQGETLNDAVRAAPAPQAETDTTTATDARGGTDRPPPAQERAQGRQATTEPASDTTCQVLPGDTLSAIAARVYHDRGQWKRIFDANRDLLPSPEKLRAGQTLRVPPLPDGVASAGAVRL